MPARDQRPTRMPSGAPVPSPSRVRISAALQRCTSEERAVLALLLFERLTPPEAADALGVSEKQVERIYESLIRDLRGAERDGTFRRSGRRRTSTNLPVRKAA
jgi:DNA-directed RNA polymerase specialized sigma24 family protein